MSAALLSVQALTVRFSGHSVVDGVTFQLGAGDVLGLVGESGSGKTTVALSLLGYRAWNAELRGAVLFRGRDMLKSSKQELRAQRGRHIAYVPQNPTTALNPARRIGSLLAEFLHVHGVEHTPAEARNIATEGLRSFGFTDPGTILDRYPHQLSGGQQQRVALCIATICRPAVVVLDEPTTGLDLVTQKITLDLLARLRDELNTAMVYVTHDLSVLGQIATHVGVLYAGRLVETGQVHELLANPLHPYTRGLIASRPKITAPWAGEAGLRGLLRRDELPPGCPFSPRCELAVDACRVTPQVLEPGPAGGQVACWRWELPSRSQSPVQVETRRAGCAAPMLEAEHLNVDYRTANTLSLWTKAPVSAVSDASLFILPGEILAIVGESGSGKSTLAKAIAGLVKATSGTLRLNGTSLPFTAAKRTPAQRRTLQLVFQNPDASLNPRRRVGRILGDALLSFERLPRAEIRRRVARVLAEVKLPESYVERFPDQLSGGERQRVAIARGLIVGPDVLICDEVLSALDVSVQAGILELLRGLCRTHNLAILFISHDLAVVRAVADRIIVLRGGRIVTATTAAELLTPPLHPYLHELLSALPGENVLPTSSPPEIAAERIVSRHGVVA